MKMKQVSLIYGIGLAVVLSAGSLMAQDNAGGGTTEQRRNNFDPVQFQQRMMDTIKERLAFTNDTEWKAVQPLVQKVMDARRDAAAGMFGMSRRGDSRRGSNGQSSMEAESLQKLIDSNAPAGQIKTALEKYRAARKDKEAKLEVAQEDLRKILTVRQESQAVLMGLVK